MRRRNASGRGVPGVLFSLAAIPGIVRPPNYQRAQPIPASEVELALVVFAGLVALGLVVALLWNRWSAER